MKQDIDVIGIPFCHGQTKSGTERGPADLRESGLLKEIENLGNTVTDYGDIKVDVVEDDPQWKNVKNPRTVGDVNKEVAKWVARITSEKKIALTLGGDHSLAVGSIFGHSQTCPDMVVVWVDAHADINTPLSSLTGNLHGMPLSFVVKEMAKFSVDLPGFEWCSPCISASDLVYIGLRDVDEVERAFIASCGIKCFSMHEVDKYGVSITMERILSSIDPSGKRPIHISFDVDAMDPEHAPSTGTPVPGGLTRREILFIAEEIANTGRLSCLDVVEVNSTLGDYNDRNKTLKSTVEAVSHFFGKRRQGNMSDDFKIPMP